MCTNHMFLANGARRACGRCKACRSQQFDDWVGRQIAEGLYADEVQLLTLTYGDTVRMGERIENPGSVTLQKRDVQKFLDRLRHYCKFRYFIAGEFGDKKGRAHWHCVLFYQDERRPPDQFFETRYFQTTEWDRGYPLVDRPGKGVKMLWPEGTVYWQEIANPGSPGAYKYVTEYALKALVGFKEEREAGLFMQSRRPPLGSAYFADLARDHVIAGLPIRETSYTLEGQTIQRKVGDGELSVGADGNALAVLPRWQSKPKRYIFTWACRKYFFEQYMRLWREEYGNDRWPFSKPLADYLDWKAGKLLVHSDQSSTVQDALADEKSHRIQQRLDSGFAYGRPRTDMLDPEDRRLRNRLDRDGRRNDEPVVPDAERYRKVSRGG